LLAGLAVTINWTGLPLFSANYMNLSVWASLIPVVFTSFGFQVIFHTLTNYCEGNVKMLKRAFFWGSLIPAIVYIIWTCSILSAVNQDNPQFYAQMTAGNTDIGELIQVLSNIAKWQSVQLLVWLISLLAIGTSVLGVGVGLCDSIKGMLSKKIHNEQINHFTAAILTILPAYLVVMYVPNAFIAVLGFAGMILAVIAILLPVYLFWQLKTPKLHYAELNNKPLMWISIEVALVVILCEMYNII
jgi:tyrosine-specific transport protein